MQMNEILVYDDDHRQTSKYHEVLLKGSMVGTLRASAGLPLLETFDTSHCLTDPSL